MARYGWPARVPYDWCMTEASEQVRETVSEENVDIEQVSSAVEVAEAWLAELSDQIAVPASHVQDRLWTSGAPWMTGRPALKWSAG